MKFWSTENAAFLLPVVLFMLALSVFLGFIYKNKSNKQKNKIFIVLTIIILIIESGKQILNLINFFEGNEYNLYYLPLHFCSIFLYVFPLAHLSNSKLSKAMVPVSVIYSATMVLFFYISPMLVIGNSVKYYFNVFKEFNLENYIEWHTVTYHNLVCLYFMLIISLGFYKPQKADFKKIVIGVLIFCTVSAVMANALNTNYNGFLNCYITEIENLRQSLIASIGWLGQLLFVFGMSAATFIFSVISWYFYLSVYYLRSLICKIHYKKLY
jgi:hypothetical protein